ncbi:c-type cytochrome [Gracilimonas sp.]|uniref:c-type cytochrome n=1 Tax=Gracilimonas sp. TaxID=1974203 RepID=UPI0032EE1A4C
MKKLLMVLGVLFLIVIVGVAGLLTYVSNALPNVGPAPDIQIEQTTERIERGKYLANSVMLCTHCHSPQEKTKFTHPIDKTMLGAGGNRFGAEEGFPGNYYASNLTPANLDNWTDGEIYRAVTEGVSKDGRALFPIMPYPNYAKMNKEDIYSIIAYLRTLDPVENEVPVSESFFPMNLIINTIPMESELAEEEPDKTDPVSWGKYLVTAASCMDCHTPMEQGTPIPGMTLAGGMEFPMEDGSIVRTANITPDIKTGIGSWTEQQFVSRFKYYADSTFNFHEVAHGEFNTAMPWSMYAQMSEDELKAIYAYLRTAEPVDHLVTRFTPVVD